ncbi:MAG TPA: hypothetical protein VJP79_01815 [Nitrososphaera sp.]|nr:hypothetical protein [Nitrososphaera sp.]
MGSGIAVPAIAGLAVGVTIIILFASYATSVFTLSNEEILNRVGSLPEVQAFYERAGNSHVFESARHQGNNILVTFVVSRMWGYEDPNQQTSSFVVRKTLQLSVEMNESGETHMELSCLGPVSSGREVPTVESIRYSSCLEPSSDDFAEREGKEIQRPFDNHLG